MAPKKTASKKVAKNSATKKVVKKTVNKVVKKSTQKTVTKRVTEKAIAEEQLVLQTIRGMRDILPGDQLIAECGVVGYEFLLDFGSFRDLQRHRAVVQRLPLLTRTHGFEGWYLESLPDELRKKAQSFIVEQEKKIDELETTEAVKQYYTAMGYRVPCRVIGDLKALVYLVELRSTRFVHPTLVEQMLFMIKSMKELFANDGLVLHQDDEPNRFDVRRGEHDIVMK